VFRLKKAIYGTNFRQSKQPVDGTHAYLHRWKRAVNSEKTIFMKRAGDDFIIHGLFVDDIKSVPTKKALLDEFIAKYSKEFEIRVTGGQLMARFLGLSVEQDNHCISLHLDQYIRKTIEEYQKFIHRGRRVNSWK
jgi:hypothetical protein